MIRTTLTKITPFATSSTKRSFWKQLINSFDITSSLESTEPINILSSNSSCIKSWESYDDRPFKGKSISSIKEIKNSADMESFINFKGDLIYNNELVAIDSRNKGTFCACRGNFQKTLDLRDYQGLGLTVKSIDEDMSFTFNMYCESSFERDLYQIMLQIPKNEWFTFHIPFHLFKLTANGIERENQRINDNLQVNGIGFLVTNTSDSKFNLHIKDVTAIPVIDTNVLRQTLRTKQEEEL